MSIRIKWNRKCKWRIPKEYELNKTYADDKVVFSEYLKGLREEVCKDTLKKLGK